ncbi:MATE family efflux transporter [Paenibacillus amylolyticus]|nr:MATE family efflux transporter [Paenibacillus amylolyticus]WFR61133.1 MATE family efflux transporter [Paenibacillus amylolyticus]
MMKVVIHMDAENLHYFEKAPIAKAVAHFAVPMMLGTSMSVIYSILNAYFLGTLGNTAMLTALALTLPLFAVIMALGNLIGIGSGTFISRLLGEKKADDLKHVSSFAFYSSLVLGIIVIAVGLPLIEPIVHGLGQRRTPSDLRKSMSRSCLSVLHLSFCFLRWRISCAQKVQQLHQ